MKNVLTSTTTQIYQFNFSDKNKLKIISFFASGLSGFFGAAGALFFNWIAQFWLGRDMKEINGLALFTISLSAIMSILARILWQTHIIWINWYVVSILFVSVACGAIGVVLGKRYEKRLKEKQLRWLFIGILLFTGLRLLGFIPAMPLLLPINIWMTAGIWSLIAGISSPPLGMGAGVFLVPAFLTIGFNRDEGILMSLIVSAVLMLFGSWLFHKAKRLDVHDMRCVWLPAVLGAPVGVWVSYQISPAYFQHLFGILLVVGALKTLYDVNIYFRHLIKSFFSLYAYMKQHVLKFTAF